MTMAIRLQEKMSEILFSIVSEVEITDSEWDGQNTSHSAKHCVHPYEVEELAFDKYAIHSILILVLDEQAVIHIGGRIFYELCIR
jgi:hypothetical protein